MALEKLHFETVDGDVIDVPFAKDSIRRKAMLAFHKKSRKEGFDPADTDDEMFKAAGIDKKTFDIIDNMTVADYNAFVTKWMEGFDSGK